jgi:UDP:flavonoid glycosyltransferase YjiC (YdhE family)
MGVPCFGSALQPLARTRAFPNIQVHPRWKLGGAFNYLTHVFGEQAFWMMLRRPINAWRREALNLPPIGFGGPMRVVHQKRMPYLFGYSQHVVPKPSDWGDWLHVTGYWFLDGASDWRPPPHLRDFLCDGPPPVCVGFGSMTPRQAEFLTTTAIEAFKRAGQRGILLTGWGGIGQSDLPDTVLKIDAATHAWLFPRMAAIVHHGGAGTTAEALRAGVPSIVTPFFADQPFWGQRVSELGVGPAPIPQKQLTAEKLADAVHIAVTDAGLRDRAAALGQKIRAEDGVARAVDATHRHLG